MSRQDARKRAKLSGEAVFMSTNPGKTAKERGKGGFWSWRVGSRACPEPGGGYVQGPGRWQRGGVRVPVRRAAFACDLVHNWRDEPHRHSNFKGIVASVEGARPRPVCRNERG